MYQVDMYYTIKTLLKQGKSQRAISKEPDILFILMLIMRVN